MVLVASVYCSTAAIALNFWHFGLLLWCLWLVQLMASRSLPSTLTSLPTATGTPTASSGDVALSPTTQFVSSSVDVVRTMWGTNPFGDLPLTDTATTGVFELTVRDSVTGVDAVLNDTVDLTVPRSLPVHFWIAVPVGAIGDTSTSSGSGTSGL